VEGRKLLIIAHRGSSGHFPENTLRAFTDAFDCGADMCELDVRLTGDGEPVVLHDATVDRTTDGHGPVEAMRLEELKRLDAGVKFGAQFAGERVPTLAEVFALTAGRGALNLELKAGGAVDAVCELIISRNAFAWTVVSSFDWGALNRVHQRAPEIRIGLLASRRPAQLLAAARELRASIIIPRFDLVDKALCSAAHKDATEVLTWTVDSPELMRKLGADGVDGIMTNYPDRLRCEIRRDQGE
jgi:glycerophosphoryl diester phosphodiesterase